MNNYSLYIFGFVFILLLIKFTKEDTAQNILNNKYINGIVLSDENLLTIFNNAIYIYNSDLSQQIRKIEYESDFSIGENDLDLINLSIFDDGVVIAIIKTYLYLFSPTGEYIYHINLEDDLNEASYYSLVPHKIIGNNYYYTISFIDSSYKLRIYYYYINISDKINNKIDYLQYSHSDTNYKIYNNNKGVSCQLMSPLNEDDVLTCFYEVTYSSYNGNFLVATSFNLDNLISQSSTISIVYQSNESPGYFKSAVTKDKTKTLICYSKTGQGGRCTFYNILTNSFLEDKQYTIQCQYKPKGMHVDYFSKTKEFIFSCSNSGIKLGIMKFDENGNQIGDASIPISSNYYFTGYSLYSYSILLLSGSSQYSIIYTSTSDNAYHYLLSPDFNPSVIYNDDSTESPTTDNSLVNDNDESTTIIEKSETNIVSDIETNYITYTSTLTESEADYIAYNSNIIDSETDSITYTSSFSDSVTDSIIVDSETDSITYTSSFSDSVTDSIIVDSETDSITYTSSFSDSVTDSITEQVNLEEKEEIKEEELAEEESYNNKYKECSNFLNGEMKCLYCNEDSLLLNKCIECNYELGYYPIIYEDRIEKYKECYPKETKINNFYFDSNSKSFRLCYELCNTCENGGNAFENNCTSCIFGYKIKNNSVLPNNCILDCEYYYYFSDFGQYRCTIDGQCPLDSNLLIRPKNECVNNCKKDSFYIYQYNSECLENCPNGTIENEFNICVDKNTNVCSLSNFDLDVNIEEIETNNIELSASNYAKEFSYTNNHISQFNNELYSYILFKNSTCIDELTLNFTSIDFGSCYKNIQSYYNTTDELIISIMNLKSKQNKPVTLYEVFEPKNGKKIDIESICPNHTILINENILNYLFNKFSKNLLSEQKIDIFNLSGPFYTDICYHFESPVRKDIPLKDRITSFYPNISLCDNGCLYKGVNLETLKTECECKINDFIDNYLLFNNFPLTDLILNNAINLVKESNSIAFFERGPILIF